MDMGSEIPRGAFEWLIKPYKRQELLQSSERLTTPPHRHREQQDCLEHVTSPFIHPAAFPIQSI